MSIRVNMQLTGNAPIEANAKNFPRLFTGDKQTKTTSIVFSENGLDVQTLETNNALLARTIEVWADAEKIKLNKQLADIQRKLEILGSIKED